MFSWWVPYTLNKRGIVISSIRLRLIKTTCKYVIKIPTSVDYLYKIDKKNKDTFWQYKIFKEMNNAGISLGILYRDHHVPVGWKKITDRMVFGVKIYFAKKAHWLLDGNRTPDPE